MGRTKTISGGGGTNSPSSSDSNPASNTAQKSETRIKDLLKELYTLIHNVQVYWFCSEMNWVLNS